MDINKQPGDLILARDWNIITDEITSLENNKVNRDGPEHMTGPLTIDNEVGVGTNSPTQKLHVVGNQILLENEDGSKNIFLRVDGAEVDIQTNSSHFNISSADTDHHIVLNPSTNDGNVGIGTNNPVSKLHVLGDILIEGSENLYALGARSNLKVITGHITEDGNPTSEDSFTVQKISDGIYTVKFLNRFNAIPVVLCSIDYGRKIDPGTGDTFDEVIRRIYSLHFTGDSGRGDMVIPDSGSGAGSGRGDMVIPDSGEGGGSGRGGTVIFDSGEGGGSDRSSNLDTHADVDRLPPPESLPALYPVDVGELGFAVVIIDIRTKEYLPFPFSFVAIGPK